MDLEEQLAHQTRLAQWALRALGQALFAGAIVGGLVALLGSAANEGALVALAPVAGVAAAGAVLAMVDSARAPSLRR